MPSTTILALGLFMGTLDGNSFTVLVPRNDAALMQQFGLPAHQFDPILPGLLDPTTGRGGFTGEIELVAGSEGRTPVVQLPSLPLEEAPPVNAKCLSGNAGCGPSNMTAWTARVRFVGEWTVTGVDGFDLTVEFAKIRKDGGFAGMVRPSGSSVPARATVPGIVQFRTTQAVCVRINGGRLVCPGTGPRATVPDVSGVLPFQATDALPHFDGLLVSLPTTDTHAEHAAYDDLHWTLFRQLSSTPDSAWTPVPVIVEDRNKLKVWTDKNRPWICPMYVR